MHDEPPMLIGFMLGMVFGAICLALVVDEASYEINGIKYFRNRGHYYRMLDSSVEIQLVPMLKEK